ncbi:glycoside hydrolase family 97 N-terminal domain-containing protein [Anaeromassilibacillus senegalensis]|uniref:glycoside hydrolase family 97 N-terminal domain-containing protein n=1 Tax=Anaeromassilibacillus senegalensis TaxID=1673717 RepID=UPI000682AF28|nr:glycoside hydrolase family 97 N-terminal domain-containing protein [Anaeromassilibacillus senegalensis]
MEKRKRVLSLALSAAMLLTAVFPGPGAFAARQKAAPSIPEDAERVQSQDGSVEAGFWLDENGKPMYAVQYKDKLVVEPSAMGMELTFLDASLSGTYDTGFTLLGTELREDVDESWINHFGDRKEVPNVYDELTLQYEAENGVEIDVVCRVSDEGAAFRYEFPQSDAAPEFQIDQERTYFNLDNSATAYVHVNRNQTEVQKIPVDELAAVKNGYFRPLTVIGSGYAMTVTEANQVDYTRVHFTQDGEDGTLRTMFNGTSDNSDLVPEHKVDPVTVDVSTDKFATSWRTFVLGDHEGQLLEHSYLVKNLNPECALDDTSWIEPGTVLRSGLSEERAKAAIDFAAGHNVPYVHFDAGWYGPEGNMNSDPWECIKFDFSTVRDYAEEHGVKLMVYVNYRHLEDQYNRGQLDALFQHYVDDFGISGIKFGFVPVGSQASTKMVYEWVKIAAENHLIVDIHDEMLPTGYERTYPNLLSMEAIHGDEENPYAEEDLGYLFTRSIAGQADHTWCYNQTKNTTKAFKFAGSIAFFSPLVFPYWYDDGAIDRIDTKPLGLWDNLPTVWDDTKVLEASIEKYATIARRSGEQWFLASLSADDGKTLELPLDFLDPDTTYKAEFFTNDPQNDRNVALFTYLVDADTFLKNRTPYNAGYSVMMTPATAEEEETLPVYSASFDDAEAVIEKIAGVGDVTVENAEEKQPLLQEIRVAYDALNTAQKLYVTNYQSFVEKESYLDTLYNHPLRALTVNGESFADFDPDTFSYNVVLQGGADVPEIGGVAEDGSEVTAVSQVKTLPGSATITAANRFAEKTYTVNFAIPDEELSVYAGDMPTPALDGRKEYKINTNRGGGALTLYDGGGQKKTFPKGIGTHANTNITYSIEGMGITRFQAFCGVSADNGKDNNKVKCQVYVDNTLAFDSGVIMQKTPYQSIDIDVSGAKTVKLVANDGGDGISNDHVNWCEAKFIIGEIFTTPITHMVEKAETCLATLTDEAQKAELQQAIDAANAVKNLPQEELTYTKVYDAAIALRDVLENIQGGAVKDIVIPQAQMSAASTSQSGSDPASNAIDGNPATKWHTAWDGTYKPLPQSITIDLGETYDDVYRLRYLPRQDNKVNGEPDWNGTILSYEISVSVDGEHFTDIAKGVWAATKDEKSVSFTPAQARYVRLTALTSKSNTGSESKQFASAAEINVVRNAAFRVNTAYLAAAIADAQSYIEKHPNAEDLDTLKKLIADSAALLDAPLVTQEDVNAARAAIEKELDRLEGQEPEGDFTSFTPGQVWNDTDGVPIQAHGGGVIWDENTQKYYWYGEHKGEQNIASGRVSAIGVSVYSSTDLYNWKNEGVALPVFNNPAFTDADAQITGDTPLYLAESSQSYQDAVAAGGTASPHRTLEKYNKATYIEKLNALYEDETAAEKKALYNMLNWNKVLERPKVIYNEKTGKYVMWFHRDGPNATDNAYSDAQAGVAVSDSPTGPFKFLGSSRPNGAMSRDMTLFKDDDGTAYLVHSSESNWTLYIQKLDETYTKVTGEYTRNYTKHTNVEVDGREAPAMFKHDGRYYIVSSGCTGWRANVAGYSSTELDLMTTMADPYDANALAGPFTNDDLKNPCTGSGAAQTFQGQSTCVFPVQGKDGMFIFMADKWNANDLRDSRYLWLPVQIDDEANELTIAWTDEWTLDDWDQLEAGSRDAFNRAVKQAADMTQAEYGADKDAWETMQSLLQRAYVLPYSASAEEVAAIAEPLQKVIDRLRLRGSLNAALSEAAKLFEAEYTPESWSALAAALAQADALPDDAAKETIDAVEAAIRDAIAKLVPVEAAETEKVTIVQAAAGSAQSGNEASKAIDGDTNTHWHTRWGTGWQPLPQGIILDLGSVQNNLCELRYLPRQDKDWNGTILGFELYASASDKAINELTDADFTKLLSAQWESTKDEKRAPFRPVSARYLKLVALSSVGNRESDNNQFASASEINVYAAKDAVPKDLTVNYGKNVTLKVNGEEQKLADLIGRYTQKDVDSGTKLQLAFAPRLENELFRSVSVNGVEPTIISGREYRYDFTMGMDAANLQFVFETVNKTTLDQVVAYAKARIDAGEIKGLIPVVQEKFMAAYDAAVAVQKDAAATQGEINTAWKDLMNMLHYLEFKPGDKKDLDHWITVAESMNADLFTEASWAVVANALAEAKGVMADENALQGDITKARDTLYDAIMALVDKVDRTELDAFIAEGTRIEGILDTDYLPVGQEAFKAALKAARELPADADQAAVNAAALRLVEAMSGLRLIPTREALKEQIDAAESIDRSLYTDSSLMILDEKIAAAKDAYENAETQEEITKAFDELVDAQEKLTKRQENGKTSSGSSTRVADNSYGSAGTAVAGAQNTAAYVRSDTTMNFALKRGQAYCFKMTVFNGNGLAPNFTVGDGSVLKTQFVAQIGNDYYFRVWAIGAPGTSAGVYTSLNGKKAVKHCTVSIG